MAVCHSNQPLAGNRNAPSPLQDEGATRGATCFTSRARANGRTRLSYGSAKTWRVSAGATILRLGTGYRSGFYRLAACLAPTGRSLNSTVGTCLRVRRLIWADYMRHPMHVKVTGLDGTTSIKSDVCRMKIPDSRPPHKKNRAGGVQRESFWVFPSPAIHKSRHDHIL
jgi:hypothetical protein